MDAARPLEPEAPPPDQQRLRTLEMVVSELDAHVHHLQAVVQLMGNRSPDQEDAPIEAGRSMRDEVWACANCAARLGIYNPAEDQLRVRYKDFVAYIKPGVGGSIMVPCRRCGEQNLLDDTRGARV